MSDAVHPQNPVAPLRSDARFRAALLGFVATLTVLIVGGAVGFARIRHIGRDNQQLRDSYQVIMSVANVLSTVKDAETGQRGYLLTDDAKYLQPYNQALETLRSQTSKLQQLVRGDSVQRPRVDTLGHLIDLKMAELAQTVALVQRGDRAAALEIVRTDSGKHLMDAARQTAVLMNGDEQVRRQLLAADIDGAVGAVGWCIVLTSVTGVLLVSLVLSLVRSSVTQRQRATDVLAAQKEQLRVTLASIGDGVIATDIDGRITTVNAVTEELTGWHSASAVGKPLESVFRIVNEESRASVENPATRALREGMIVGLANHTLLIAKDGTERPIEDSAAPIRASDGTVIGCVLVFRDGTARREAEEHADALLAELRRAADDLSEANHRKDEFLATLAHELRNPLAPVRNSLRIMRLARSGSSNPPADDDALTMIERQVGQMVRLVDDLLDVSRISRGRESLQLERGDIAAILRDAIDASRPFIDAGGHILELVVPPEPIVVDVDVTRIEQVFTNLINNAAKYSERGGRITVTATLQGRTVAVHVSDSGVGIPEAMLQRIFDLFTQVDRSLERSQGGLGIGLTLVKRLVEMHGGTVVARSDGAGMGSEFVVRLPLAVAGSQAPVVPVKQAAQPARAARPLRVLVADDNADSTGTLARLLELMGHEPRVASDGMEAVSVAAEFRPEVILLDIGMPRLNGYEACRRIRQSTAEHRPWILAISGWGHDSDKQRSTEAGFDHHLVKPVDPRVLEELLATLANG